MQFQGSDPMMVAPCDLTPREMQQAKPQEADSHLIPKSTYLCI